MAIDWAIRIPLQEHYQNFVAAFILSIPFVGIFSTYFAIFKLPSWIPIVYTIWFLYDLNSCHRGGWNWRPGKTWGLWNYFIKVSPFGLVKTADIDPSRNYLFCCHPHSHIPQGSVNFVSEANGISKLYKGLRFHVLTLTGMHQVPILRELIAMLGLCSVSKDNFEHLLTKCGNGNGLAFYPGGDQEGKLATARTMKVFLKNRKGFVRMALQYGADLVPVINFGENDAYETLQFAKDSWIPYLQEELYRRTRILIPLINGRGLFQNSFGILPLRRPVTTVIGSPIKVVKTIHEAPTENEVESLHQEYIRQLTKLYYDHRENHGYGEVKLIVH